jgi:DNA polymerase-3 subunit delta'
VRAPVWQAVVGQDAALAVLARAVATDRVGHAYAFIGPAGVGRRLAARGLAQACLCAEGGCGACASCRRVAAERHPDCQVIVPTPPEDNPRGALALRIEQVRALEHRAALAPHEGRRKVFILDDAERLTPPAAQALLKTLEEPPPRTLLVLILSHPRALPATVLSRCQRVRFRALDPAAAATVLEARGVAAADSGLLARLCQGQIGLALATDLGAVRAHREAALALARAPRTRLALALDAAGLERPAAAAVVPYLEVCALWCRDALLLGAGGDPALVVNTDRTEALAAAAAAVPPAALVRALAGIKAAWLALDSNVSPRAVLEQALLAMPVAAAGQGA